MRRLVALLLVLFGVATAEARAELLDFSAAEITRLLRHGPWPPPLALDPSNRVSGNPEAVALGRALFFETGLAPDKAFSCASCHDPARGWSDGRPLSQGRVALSRNVPSLLDVRLRRWFGWDGGQDNLWAMSLRPILDSREIGGSVETITARLRGEPKLGACYALAFKREPESVDEKTLSIDAAKALAAFQETLVSPRSPFDDFRDALERGDKEAAARLPVTAQRGARLFVGRGQCATCHLGPAFTNGEFHDIGIPFFTADGVDSGRHAGIKTLKESPLTLLGAWNDDPDRASGTATRHVDPQHRNFGEFRVPSLRNAALTAPYMHNGSLATLADAIRHYSDLDPDRLHGDGEAILKPLKLTPSEIDDLTAFIESLTSHSQLAGSVEPRCP